MGIAFLVSAAASSVALMFSSGISEPKALPKDQAPGHQWSLEVSFVRVTAPTWSGEFDVVSEDNGDGTVKITLMGDVWNPDLGNNPDESERAQATIELNYPQGELELRRTASLATLKTPEALTILRADKIGIRARSWSIAESPALGSVEVWNADIAESRLSDEAAVHLLRDFVAPGSTHETQMGTPSECNPSFANCLSVGERSCEHGLAAFSYTCDEGVVTCSFECAEPAPE